MGYFSLVNIFPTWPSANVDAFSGLSLSAEATNVSEASQFYTKIKGKLMTFLHIAHRDTYVGFADTFLVVY